MILQCACCGGEAPAKKQWWNQDKSWGICARCYQSVLAHEVKLYGEVEGKREAERAYGLPGIHHSLEGKEP